MTAVIAVDGLTRSFGARRGVADVTFEVGAGEVFGFLGPNGAGKSTTIRLLLGLYRPMSGRMRVFDLDPADAGVEIHRRVGYLPGELALYPRLTGQQHLDYAARVRGLTDHAFRDELVERFHAELDRPVHALSKGNRQKIGLVLAFMHRPDLLVLDEPTSGLDPLMEEVFTECLGEATAAGRSVLLSSHILSEVEKVCDTVTIIRNGRTVEAGTLAELRHLTRSTVTAVTRQDPASLSGVPGVHGLAVDGCRVTFHVDAEHLDVVLGRLAELGPSTLVCAPPSLEQLLLQHYGGQLPAPVGAR
jgi:ABC-2 type transport system ATP-binding protein